MSACKRLTEIGVFAARGGDGGNGSGAATGGGGVIYLMAREYNGTSLSCQVNGGTAGTGGDNSAPNPGSVGTIELYKINSNGTVTFKGTNCAQSWTAD